MGTRFRSTRGSERVSFEEALLRGLAPDGGLYIPDRIPSIDLDRVLRASSFPDLGFEVLRSWIGNELDEDVLRRILDEALDFPVRISSLEKGEWKDVHVLELFHGPTLSFKDFGARTMARWMRHFLTERREQLTILVATSGDTGSAVADGFAGQERIEVVLLYPKGQVSPVQERQLILARPGVRAFAVEGDFDDCQRLVKEAFADARLRDVRLSSANSINIGRLLPQMLYYVWAVRHLQASAKESLEAPLFCVPSGNLGNLTGGVLAHLSGMPARGFLAAHNANDFFPRYLAGDEARFGATIPTLSNAMDVGAPSNFERLEVLLDGESMRRLILGASVTDEETLAAIRRVHEETGYLADPHTAVGLEAVRRTQLPAERPVVVLSTAHPAKFPETIERAVGFEPEEPARLAALWERETSVESLEPTLEALREALGAPS